MNYQSFKIKLLCYWHSNFALIAVNFLPLCLVPFTLLVRLGLDSRGTL